MCQDGILDEAKNRLTDGEEGWDRRVKNCCR